MTAYHKQIQIDSKVSFFADIFFAIIIIKNVKANLWKKSNDMQNLKEDSDGVRKVRKVRKVALLTSCKPLRQQALKLNFS